MLLCFAPKLSKFLEGDQNLIKLKNEEIKHWCHIKNSDICTEGGGSCMLKIWSWV